MATTVRSARTGTSGPFGQLRNLLVAKLVGVAGSVAAIVGLFLPWRTGGIHASDVPVAFLWNRSASGGPSLLIGLIPLVVVLAVATFIPFAGRARLGAALALLVVAALFAFQLDRTLVGGSDLGDALDSGFDLVAIGSLLVIASMWRPQRGSPRRRIPM